MTDLAFLETTSAIAQPSAVGPLAVLVTPAGHHAVEAGETFEISLTLHNQGHQGAIIDIYIDESSQPLGQWCSNPYERLALETGHSSEVRFKVPVPAQTLPGSYDYLIVVDAPDHYPEETPLRYPATLRVLPSVKAAVNLSDATFAIQPSSHFDRPIALQPAAATDLQIVVHNRSSQVDQFRLDITDLPADWYDITYSQSLGELGLSTEADHLPLNPGVKGTIRVGTRCPENTLAGRYLATLRLRSLNNPRLALMEAAYFEVAAQYQLTIEAEAIVHKVKRQAALFHLHLTNAGNTARDLSIQPKEDREDPLFTYELEPPQVHIPAMSTAHATLSATPKSQRHRAWIGPGKAVSFRLETEDRHALPLPEVTTAQLTWERRPWWHLALVLLLAAGLVSTALSLIWWQFLRPPAAPKITTFGATAPTYYQQRDDFVTLSWQIDNAEQIQTLKLQSQTDADTVPLPPLRYDLTDGLPPALASHCVLARSLSCQSIQTGARQPGTYEFTLSVVSNPAAAAPITAETGAVTLLPTPPPEVIAFETTQPRYWEAASTETDSAESDQSESAVSVEGAIALSWNVSLTEPLAYVTVAARLADGTPLNAPERYDLSKGLPETLEDDCTLTESTFTCRELPTKANTVGTYLFELKLFTADRLEPVSTAETEPAQVVPLPVRIESFTIDGQDTLAKYRLNLLPEADASAASVNLAWKVVGGPYTQVEILPSPGSVDLVGDLTYPVTVNEQEVVTLKVTSVSGEEIVRSVIIETVQPELPLPEALAPASVSPIDESASADQALPPDETPGTDE